MRESQNQALYQDSDWQRHAETIVVNPDALPPEHYRSPARIDYARIVHSTSFRRLSGKMQLFPNAEGDYFRNRLTHSLEVAQVAKSIAIKLNNEPDSPFTKNPINIDLIELASLAHDLGHPPFGHEGEAQLDECMKTYGGFEGNAQTLRLLSRVEKKILANPDDPIVSDHSDNRRGLNLTYRSLAAVLKYDNEIPAARDQNAPVQKGYYSTEKGLVEEIKQRVSSGTQYSGAFKTIECQIMDIADDIAYSTYDLDDALKSGLVGVLDLLAPDDRMLEAVADKTSKALGKEIRQDDVHASLLDILDSQKIFEPLKKATDFDHKNINNVAFQIGALHKAAKELTANGYYRNTLTSHLVGEFVRATYVKPNKDALQFSEVKIQEDVWLKVEVLKHLAFHFLIESPRWKVTARRAREIISYIFTALTKNDGYSLLPMDFQQIYHLYENNDSLRRRVVCDFIACMTDEYAVEFYSRLQSDKPSSFFKPLV